MKIDLGIDFGTSKIAVSAFLVDEGSHDFLLLGKYFKKDPGSIYCRPTISFVEGEEDKPIFLSRL